MLHCRRCGGENFSYERLNFGVQVLSGGEKTKWEEITKKDFIHV
jgi:predicted nucleic-acid-binding Zn-ribbon protein